VSRILVVQNLYPPHHYGGYEQSCHDVVERWRDRGHDVTVLTGDHRVRGVRDAAAEPGVRRELPVAIADGVLASPPRLQRLRRERAAQRILRAAIEETEPDVVSVWHMAGVPAGLLHALVATELPLVYVVCDDWLSYVQTSDPWLRMFAVRPRLGRLAARFTRLPTAPIDLGPTGAFCFVSDCTRRRSEAHTGWTFPLATVTFSGIDTTDFPIALSAPTARPWQGRLLYVGRLDERKGVGTAIRAMARLPDATLELVGPGDAASRRRFEVLAAESGVAGRVTFSAPVPRAGLRDRYAAADALVFPSEWDEPFGLVPVEAMACASPVVATATGGSAEFLVDGDNCLVFAPGDAAALAAAVTRLSADAGLRRRLVGGGSRTASALTADGLADVLEAWHEGAAARFAGGRPPDRRLPFGQPASGPA